MPQNTITYTQSRIGFTIISSGSGCHGQIRPSPSVRTNSIGSQPGRSTNDASRRTDNNSFRPIDPSIRTVRAQSYQVVRPRVTKQNLKVPGRAYRVHTEATYTPETYSKSARITTNTIQQGATYTYAHTLTPESVAGRPSAKRPPPSGSSTETATEGEDTATGSSSLPPKPSNISSESISPPIQSDRQTSERKKRQRRVDKAEIKRLNKVIQSGELRAVGHWTRAIRTWTGEVESELHAIKEGTRIIESLVGRLSLQ